MSDSEILAISRSCDGVSDMWVVSLSEMMMNSSVKNNLEYQIFMNEYFLNISFDFVIFR